MSEEQNNGLSQLEESTYVPKQKEDRLVGVAAPVLAAAVILPRAVNVGAVAGAVVHQCAAGTAVFIPVAAAP